MSELTYDQRRKRAKTAAMKRLKEHGPHTLKELSEAVFAAAGLHHLDEYAPIVKDLVQSGKALCHVQPHGDRGGNAAVYLANPEPGGKAPGRLVGWFPGPRMPPAERPAVRPNPFSDPPK